MPHGRRALRRRCASITTPIVSTGHTATAVEIPAGGAAIRRCDGDALPPALRRCRACGTGAGSIAEAGKRHVEKGQRHGQLAPPDIDQAAPGPLSLWTRNAWLVMSTLPPAVAPGLDHQ